MSTALTLYGSPFLKIRVEGLGFVWPLKQLWFIFRIDSASKGAEIAFYCTLYNQMRTNGLKKAKVKDSAARSAIESFFACGKLKSAAHSAIDAAGTSAWLHIPQSACRFPRASRLPSAIVVFSTVRISCKGLFQDIVVVCAIKNDEMRPVSRYQPM
ncbi:hypothetical protein [Paenibacillus sonchi]|uniref:hypothetical protein n=1 Tax=Paenibacillus sonchi TaxID=373687 RepID=UPI001E45F17C|nr:hypothetical protein [Paenibacillus sonchi]